MTNRYSQLKSRIADLEAKAEALRKSEVSGVIAKIKEAIKFYDITPRDLFGNKLMRASKLTRAASAKYADSMGNTWGGRGPRPQWLRDALASGAALQSFAVGATRSKAAAKSPSKPSKVPTGTGKARRPKVKMKYRDGDNAWSGRGSQPRWLREKLAGGAKLEDFLV